MHSNAIYFYICALTAQNASALACKFSINNCTNQLKLMVHRVLRQNSIGRSFNPSQIISFAFRLTNKREKSCLCYFSTENDFLLQTSNGYSMNYCLHDSDIILEILIFYNESFQ